MLANIIGNGIEAIAFIGKSDKGVITIKTDTVSQDGVKLVELVISNDGPPLPDGALEQPITRIAIHKLLDQLPLSGNPHARLPALTNPI